MGKTHYCVARVETRTKASVGKFERHIERKNESYENMNVDLSRTHMNVSFKSCGEQTYNERLEEMVAAGVVSLRGLPKDAKLYDEMILDVNTDYFERHGGYEFACRFYEEAYRFCQRIYGEEYILSAVMHADELNIAATQQYGKPVYHYHLHVMALPVVEKEVRWTKRCKDPALVGTVKEVVQQVSHSKKWKSEVMLDEQGNPLLNKKGKPVLQPSYSVLQDKFYEHMTEAGFTDFERGERGSTAEHLTVVEYKVQQEEERLQSVVRTLAEEQKYLEDNCQVVSDMAEIERRVKKSITGKYPLSEADFKQLVKQAQYSHAAVLQTHRLRKENEQLRARIRYLEGEVSRLKAALQELNDRCKPYLDALKAAPQKMKEFIEGILEKTRPPEPAIYHRPRIRRPKSRDYER